MEKSVSRRMMLLSRSNLGKRKVGKRKAPAKAVGKGKAKGGKAAKDPNKPKRPPSAFFVFLEEFRKTFKKENPTVKAVSAVGKDGGEKWKSEASGFCYVNDILSILELLKQHQILMAKPISDGGSSSQIHVVSFSAAVQVVGGQFSGGGSDFQFYGFSITSDSENLTEELLFRIKLRKNYGVSI